MRHWKYLPLPGEFHNKDTKQVVSLKDYKRMKRLSLYEKYTDVEDWQKEAIMELLDIKFMISA